MLYYLTDLRDVWGGFNVFQYITFRAGGAALTAFGLCLLLGPPVIERLRKLKIGQVQRKDGPATHLSKEGTPTMGGLLILVAVVGSVLLWGRPDQRFTWLMLWVVVGLAAVGAYDDWQKLAHRNSKGAPSWVKLTVQLAVATSVVGYLASYPPSGMPLTTVNVPYAKDLYIELGVLYFAVAILMIVGASNAVNLTDGLDGLAAGNLIFCALTYAVFAYAAGHARFSSYLRIIPVEGAGEISITLAAAAGACLGFLWYNAYPAEVFMGDTSSLFLGGLIGAAALCVRQELLLPIIGGVFVMETVSVILQMASYRLRGGKRIFLMAPIHHHFELKGWAEPKVTVRFWIIGIILSLVALASLKIR